MHHAKTALLCLAAVLAAACGSDTTSASAPAASPATVGAPAPAAGGEIITVKEVNAAGKGGDFDPPSVTVKAGTTVRWTNSSGNIHNVTFADSSLKPSLTMSREETFQTTFRRPGTYTYRCTFHPGMDGKVVVE